MNFQEIEQMFSTDAFFLLFLQSTHCYCLAGEKGFYLKNEECQARKGVGKMHFFDVSTNYGGPFAGKIDKHSGE